jgi:hypothetical protein
MPIIGLAFVLAAPGFTSERWPDAPVFPPIDPPLRPPAPERSVQPHSLKIEEFAPADTAVVLRLPTHIAFVNGFEIISEVNSDRLSYRPLGSESEWESSPLSVRSPHAVALSASQQLFYCADTDNNRVISFSRIDSGDSTGSVSIAGVALQRPHDILYDPATDLVYVLNPNRPAILRFSAFGVDEAALDLFHAAGGYSRGISLVDGKIVLAASMQGLVIEIEDFDTGEVSVHETYGKIEYAVAGSWETTGFIPNDIEFYDGYWYLSNFFHPDYASGTDHNRFKLVRFRTWDDLASGQWEELSHLVPDRQIPYFFTVHEGHLFLVGFGASDAEDAVFKITSGLFFDDFESGELSAWDR